MRTLSKLFKLFYISYLFILLPMVNFAQSDEDCMMCHEDKELVSLKDKSMYVNINVLKKSAHKKLSCIKCHTNGAANDFEHMGGEKSVVSLRCVSCHKEEQKQMENDIHRTLKLGNKAPNCNSCHPGNHNIEAPNTIKNKEEYYCGKCHENKVYNTPYHAKAVEDATCLECHDKKDYTAELTSSVHPKLSCANCHSYVVNNMEAHQNEEAKIKVQADCYLCHGEIAEEHKESIHGISIAEGEEESAHCWDCHGSHKVLKLEDENSLVYPTNLVSTCGSCHDDPEFNKKHYSNVKQPGLLYSKSVHGLILETDIDKAATCIKCHGVHNIKNRIQENSKISSVNVANTCKECHAKETEAYYNSIHWFGVRKGVEDAPTCNDCHSEHDIQAINTVDKEKEIKILQEETCLQCHESLLQKRRYGGENAQMINYQDNYHGLAVMRGDDESAMCIDCHGVHSILPKHHEDATINEKNVVKTCQKCHPNATETFSKSYTHVTPENSIAKKIEDIVSLVYIWLIIIVIGGMVLHNLVIFIHDIRKKRKASKNEIRIPRFTKNELIQHYILYISFIILVISGFMLKFPESWWVKGLQGLGVSETIRQITHRVAAVVMMGLSVYHVFYLIATKRGRLVLAGLAPKFSDLKQALHNILYYLKLKKKHPDFNNYNYIEKAEYWALIWGTLVMGLTGFILWFPTVIGDWAPVWVIKVSEIVHYYEAILASLAILVWHWFFVMFRPGEYPFSFTCVDGGMSVNHYKDEHKLEFKKIIKDWNDVKNGQKEEKDCNRFTQFFFKAIKGAGHDYNVILENEIRKDDDLKEYLEKLNNPEENA